MSTSVPLFPQLGSSASDLLDAFPHRGFEVATSVPTSNNYVASSSFTKKGGKVAGKIGLWFVGSGMVFDYSWLTNNKCNVPVATGAKAHLVSNTNKEGETTLSPTLVFANERGSISLSGRYQLDKAILSSVSAEVVSEYPKNVYWGTKVTVDSERLVKTKHTAEVVEGNSKVNFSVKRNQNLHTIGLSWFHAVSDSVTYAASLTADVNTPFERKGSKAAVGASWKLDSNTTLSGKWTAVQPARDSAQLRIALGVQQKVTSYCTASVGTDLNASKFLGFPDAKGADHNFGLKFSFE